MLAGSPKEKRKHRFLGRLSEGDDDLRSCKPVHCVAPALP